MRNALALLCLIGASCLPAQAQVTTDWVNSPGGVSVAVTPAGDVYTARWDYNPGGDITLTRRSANGSVVWEAPSGNKDSTRHEVATWVGLDSVGNILVSGTVRSGFAHPVDVHGLLLKFNPRGKLLWRRDLSPDFDGSSTRKLLIDAQDHVLVLGLGVAPNGLVTQIRKVAPDGADVWTFSDDAGIGWPMNVKWTPDGAMLISTRSLTGILNGYAKVDAAGQLIWRHAGYTSTPMGDAAGDRAGNSYLVNNGFELRKLSPAGETLWTREHSMTAMRVEVGPDDQPVLSGFPPGGGAGAAFMKYAPDGQVRWLQADGDGPGQALLLHAQMLIDRYGSAYLAASNLSSMAVTKVRADGSHAWTATAPGSSAAAIAFGPDTRVLAIGGQTAQFSQDLADLSIRLSDSPDPALVGAPLTVSLAARNKGPASAQGVSLRYALPNSVTLSSVEATQGSCSVEVSTVVCSVGSLARDAQIAVTLTLVPTRAGRLLHFAEVSETTEDPARANNQAQGKTRVYP